MRKVWRSHIITMIPSHITTTTTSDKFLYNLCQHDIQSIGIFSCVCNFPIWFLTYYGLFLNKSKSTL